jgi:hypothetical protein
MQFMFIMGLVFIFFVIFVVGFSERYRDIRTEKERMALRDVALRVHDEISLAHNLEDGYLRNFTLPDDVEGFNYSISLDRNVIVVRSIDTEYSTYVAPVQGAVRKGSNVITRKSGVVCIGC